jgi:hypothetical protein
MISTWSRREGCNTDYLFGIIGEQQRCISGMESLVPDSRFVGRQQKELSKLKDVKLLISPLIPWSMKLRAEHIT